MMDDTYADSGFNSVALRQPLATQQVALLEDMVRPVLETADGWPVWDYVQRTVFRRSVVSESSAATVWASLPSTSHGLQLAPYGLVWRESRDTREPRPDLHVGLSIAGLHRLRDTRPSAGVLADLLATVIGWVGLQECELAPNPREAVGRELILSDRVRDLLADAPGLEQVSVGAVLDVLQHEFAPLNLVRNDRDSAFTRLQMYLAAYHGIETAEMYLREVARQLPSPAYVASGVSPLQLAQMLDHLSLALVVHPQWSGAPLVNAPDLRSAASLVLGVSNDVEFRDRMAGLASILGSLQTPPIPSDIVQQRFGAQQPRPLRRLAYWLEINLAGSGGRARALDAVAVVRAAVRIRVEDHHAGQSVRAAALQARLTLGLPELVLDWAAAWDLVRIRIADAFDVIRQEVQLAH